MGDYRDKSGSERVDAPEKIDLTNIMLDVYHGVKRLWWLFIGLIIICAVQSYFSATTSFSTPLVRIYGNTSAICWADCAFT